MEDKRTIEFLLGEYKRGGIQLELLVDNLWSRAYQAGLDAALGALPKPSVYSESMGGEYPLTAKEALAEARSNIEKLKEPSNERD